MSCVLVNKSEQVKMSLKNNKLDYEEMRQRLLETERKLQSLNKLEAEIQQSVISDNRTLSSRGVKDTGYPMEDAEREELESIPSAISTIPGSYTGFDANNASTPCRFEMNRSQNNKATFYNGFESDSSSSSILPQSKYDLTLLKQNQRLLSEVERLVGDIHCANQKIADLQRDADKGKTVSELEDRCAGLVAENQAQEKKLREAEKHLDEGQRRMADLQKRVSITDIELSDVRSELSDLKLVKREVESQRDEALQNFNETQDSLDEYQKKNKERIRKLEEREDQLQEALTSTSQERDDLLDQLSTVEMSLSSQEAQINRLLNDVTSEDNRAQSLEISNQQLKTQLELLTAQNSELEKRLNELKDVKRERDELKSEMKSHRSMAKDMKALLKVLQKSYTSANAADDSGNHSFKTLHSEYSMMDYGAEGGFLAAELNCNNNGLGACDQGHEGKAAGGNMMCEMRNLVTNMDSEIQRLRCDLKQRDADDRTYSNLRDELKVLMDKVESGMRHNHELECLVSGLECDKKNLRVKLEETLSCLEERDRTMQCLETRLNERSVQIVCLQEDIDERNCRINNLEGQLHELQQKFLRQRSEGNNAESPALKEALARVKELEAILLCKNKSADELQDKLGKALWEMRSNKNEADSEIECLKSQLALRDQEIEGMKEDAESVKQKLSSVNKLLEEQTKIRRSKEDKISCLGDELEQLKYAKEATEKLLKSQIEEADSNLKSSQVRMTDLENALSMCRNEVCKHLNTMEEIRSTYENELEQRDSCIRKLKEDLRRTVEELKCKMEDNASLERSLAEARNKVQQVCCQLKEADTNIQCLNIKIQEMEKQMLKEKSTWMKESEEMDRRLMQAQKNLEVANRETETLKQHLAEKKSQVDCMQSEKTHLCQEIKKQGDQVCCLQEHAKKMESDNQELCRQLQQKMECIRDLENVIRTKEHELKCLTKYIQEISGKDNSDMQAKLEAEIKQLKEQLEKSREENKCKSTMLCECEDAFNHCQFLCNDKDNEVKMLKCQIESLNEKLNDRISRVEELERGIENLHKDVERRMGRVDEQLKKYETELVDRIQEIATLKECVNTVQLNLSEKANELQQQEQKCCLLSAELQSLNLKLKEAEDTRDHLSTQVGEKKGELSELTQQLRLNREQMQKQHEDLVQSRQSLSCVQRDADKLRRELDDTLASLEHRECEISRLNEERKSLMEKVAQISCQMEQDTSMMKQQMSETKCRLEKEAECLRNYSCQMEGNNASLSNKLTLTQRQLLQVEKCAHQKLDTMNRNLEDLTTKLSMREDEILACKDNMSLKDSEINRLKKRLCSSEKNSKENCGKGQCKNNNSNNGLDDLEEDDEIGFQNDNFVLESEECINLVEEQIGEDGMNISQNQRLSDQGTDQAFRLSTPSEASSRNSLGVTEVQERLRNNQLRQREIERQLQSLEEVSQGSVEDEEEEDKEREP